MLHVVHVLIVIWATLSLVRIAYYISTRCRPTFWSDFQSPDDLAFYRKTIVFWDILTVIWLLPAGAIYEAIDLYKYVHSKM